MDQKMLGRIQRRLDLKLDAFENIFFKWEIIGYSYKCQTGLKK